MPASAFHEALWRELPPGLEPPLFAARLAFLRAQTGPGAKVLDVGCGEGLFASALASDGAEVSCLDVAEEPLRRTSRRDGALRVQLLESEADWPLPDAGFDVVWAGEVLEHVLDTAAWMSELRRVLAPGGALVASTPALGRRELLAALVSRRAFARRFEPRSDHLHHYSAATLRGLLGDFGFERIEVSRRGGTLLCRARRSRY